MFRRAGYAGLAGVVRAFRGVAGTVCLPAWLAQPLADLRRGVFGPRDGAVPAVVTSVDLPAVGVNQGDRALCVGEGVGFRQVAGRVSGAVDVLQDLAQISGYAQAMLLPDVGLLLPAGLGVVVFHQLLPTVLG